MGRRCSGSCTLTVSFKPSTAGIKSGTLSIAENATGSPQRVSLKGTGIAITSSPASLTFATQLVGASSAAKTVTLTNHGAAAVSISGTTTSGDSARARNPVLPRSLDLVLAKALEKDRNRRYQSAAAMKDDLATQYPLP